MKTLIGIMLLVFVSGVCADTGITDRTYTNEEWDFRISLPEDGFEDWEITDERAGEALVYILGPWDDAVDFEPRIGVYTETLAEEKTVEEYLEWNIIGLRMEIGRWNENSRRDRKIASEDGYEIIYTGRANGRNFIWMQHYVVKDTRGYVITAAHGPDKFRPVPFREIMETFRFLSSPIEVAENRRLVTTWGRLKTP